MQFNKIIFSTNYLWIFLILFRLSIQLQYQPLKKNEMLAQFRSEKFNLSVKAKDYKRLRDINNFKFELISYPCIDKLRKANQFPFLLMLIQSATINFEQREAIRKTWAQNIYSKVGVFRLFVIEFPGTQILQNRVINESIQFSDILAGNMYDVHGNLTYKHVASMKYALYHCPHVRYILKADDNVIIHTPNLLTYLHGSVSLYGARNFLAGNIQISKRYSKGLYCLRSAYLYSIDVALRLYREAQNIAERIYMPHGPENIYLTGHLARKLNITRTILNSHYLDRSQMLLLRNTTELSASIENIFVVTDVLPDDIYDLWRVLTLDDENELNFALVWLLKDRNVIR